MIERPNNTSEAGLLRREERTFERYAKDLGFGSEGLRGKKILDLGTGHDAGFVNYCIRTGITQDIYGMDIRGYASSDDFPNEKDFLNRAPGKKNFVQGDVMSIPFKPEMFDLIIIRASSYTSEAIVRATKLLKSGGKLYIVPIFENDATEKHFERWHLPALSSRGFSMSKELVEQQVIEKGGGEKETIPRYRLVIEKKE